ncbi:hypothetical protein O3G_MSEX005824 [Manduca sexta]|nr:hypothetical protein O3G_MSEX005824 [Manduca sexta]KAG6448992.1 hypothetical protein O3G_MSEX005824 [Manduca sexta]
MTRSDHIIQPISPFTVPKPEPIDEPCVCSNLRNIKDTFFTNPAEIINRILKSNDLFSNKEPITSSLCCDTHEHEETVFFEIAPNQKRPSNLRANAFPPFLFDSIMPKPKSPPLKSKAVEIFLFPKRKDLATFNLPKILPKKNALIKNRIQIVGDKKPDIMIPVTSSSVKKDLLEKIETKEEKQQTQKNKDEVSVKPNAL